MSFLYKTSARTATLTQRAAFSTSFRAQKSAVDAAKDTLKSVDRTVSDVAAKGIDKGREASGKVKEAVGVNTSKAEGSAHEMAGEAKGKAAEMTGEAKGKVEEVKGKMS